jgi:glutathione peroxidase-family protein
MNFYDFSYPLANGQTYDFSQLKDKVVLIVNTASRCGFTYQYKGLEALWKAHKDKGLVILGFPCDQFAHQEPGDEAAIMEFCELNFGVTFPLFKKVNVNGKDTIDLYKHLKKQDKGLVKRIPWNFTKFLVGKDGNLIGRYAPTAEPESLEKDILKALSK